MLVWAVALSLYLLAVFHRSSLAVAGLVATERFDISASQLASFTMLQLLVYAAMQVPVGLLVDRYGPRSVLLSGAVLLAAAQTAFAFADTYALALLARFFVGMGDAMTFICVLRLLATIAGATALAFGLRALLPEPTLRQVQALDGASALVMTVLVLGLMSAIAPALRDDPLALLAWLALAFAANLGPQLLVGDLLARRGARDGLHATALIAGNRNIALFIAALPAAVTDPLLLFIGCYQIPMYLTPILLGWFYRRETAL